jgi:signal peptidase II
LKKYFLEIGPLLSVAGVIIIADQLTKALVRANLDFSEMWAPWPWLMPFARIVNWRNTGAAFGMFQELGGVFTVLAILVALAILYYYPQVPRQDWVLRLAMSMQLGGAIGNLIDRLTQGYVTDFISVGNFAVFNIADASISTGVAVLLAGMWVKERQERAAPPPAPGPAAGAAVTPGDPAQPPAAPASARPAGLLEIADWTQERLARSDHPLAELEADEPPAAARPGKNGAAPESPGGEPRG